jgi:hypothetical protein
VLITFKILAESPFAVFGPTVSATLSETLKADIREGGRCLAFELPTASGFHTMRAAEAVLLDLRRAAGCAAGPQGGDRTWGAHLTALKGKIDAKLHHHLDGIKELHRNPVAHPEVTLTEEEAISLFNAGTDAIRLMLKEIEHLAT